DQRTCEILLTSADRTGPALRGSTIPALPLCLIEIAQVGRGLVLAGRHQLAIGAQEIVVLADDDMVVVLAADVLVPDDVALLADVSLGDGPRLGEGIVDHGDLVEQSIFGGLVELDALLDDGLVVPVQWNARVFERARALEVAGLDLEQVVAAVAVGID